VHTHEIKKSSSITIVAAITTILVFFITFTAYGDDSTNDMASNKPSIWEVNNLTTWADAHYGITNGGDGKIHIVTVSDYVAIPPTAIFSNTFGSVRDITVILQGYGTITASGNGYLLRIGNRQTVIVKDLTLQGRTNFVSVIEVGSGGTFHMEGSARVTGNTVHSNDSDISAGGVRVAGGTFIMQDEAVVSDNTASTSGLNKEARGGGVFLSGGSFTMKGNARVEGNTASISFSALSAFGGGVYINSGTFTMEGGSISDNSVTGGRMGNAQGGGVFIATNGNFLMINGAISKNNVSGIKTAWGGGVSGNFTMHDGIISGNMVSANNASSSDIVEARGGGVNGNLVMHGGTISDNTVSAGRTWGNNSDVNAFGGGVFGQLTMHGGTISGNTVSANNNVNAARAAANGGGVCTVYRFTKTGGIIYGNNAMENLGNTAIGGQGHAIYLLVFGAGNNWRNAASGPNDNSGRLDFWLNEIDITYSIAVNALPATSLILTFSEDPGNLLASNIILSNNVSRKNAVVTGSGTNRTLSPITISGDGIISVSVPSIYRVATNSKKLFIIPDTPTGVKTSVTASTVTLNWDSVYLAAGYKVYRSISASGTYTNIGTASSTSFTDIRRSPGTPYFYRVTAVNSAGESIVPAQASATTMRPNTQQAVVASSDTIVIEWPRDRSWDIVMRVNNSAINAVSFIVGLPGLHSYRTSYVIYRDGKIIKEIDIPTRLSVTIVPPFFTLVQDSTMVDHFFVDNIDLKPSTTYNYRVAVNVILDFGSLEGIYHKEEDTVMTASATTLSDM
jgi:hypothetical protein